MIDASGSTNDGIPVEVPTAFCICYSRNCLDGLGKDMNTVVIYFSGLDPYSGPVVLSRMLRGSMFCFFEDRYSSVKH
jgi:hypothetical protein